MPKISPFSILKFQAMQRDLKKAKRALKLANGVMGYCAGDRWEQECTEKDREAFNRLYKQLTGEEGSA